MFYHILKNFLVLSPFLLDPDPLSFYQDPDPYQSSPWIRIRNEFFYILDSDPYQNDTDPPHCWQDLSLDPLTSVKLMIIPTGNFRLPVQFKERKKTCKRLGKNSY